MIDANKAFDQTINQVTKTDEQIPDLKYSKNSQSTKIINL